MAPYPARIDVFGLGVVGQAFAENDPYQVVRAGLVVGLLHGRGDFVVGLGDSPLYRDSLRVIAPGAKWGNDCHKKGNAEL